MNRNPTGMKRIPPAFPRVAAILLLLTGCSKMDNPVKDDPPVIVDRDLWYVNAAASGADNGSSWADAFTLVQEAVDFASEGDMIWVAAGTYDSHVPDDPAVPVLRMKTDVDIYGGFSTADTSASQRDPEANETILDGENEVWHVVIGADLARLDGFVIVSGYADGAFPDNCGGGMLNHRVSPIVENCVFTANDAAFHGAGMANLLSSPVVRNCIFRINTAANNGAGVYNDDENGIDGSPSFEDCVFGPANNCRFGGGMYNNWCEVTVTDCLFTANTANHNGGALYNTSSRAVVRSCVFSENFAYNGGAISCWHSEAEIVSCIVWGNAGIYAHPAIEIGTDVMPEVRHCDIDQGEYGMPGDGSADAHGNIRLDPLFSAGPFGNWYLGQTAAGQAADSPCVDAGTSTAISTWLTGYMTTRTDGALDSGITDTGFHYPP